MVINYDDFPLAIEPKYSAEQPNQPIVLYEGEFEFFQGEEYFQGNGNVYLKWFPYPQIEFKLFGNKGLRSNEIEAALNLHGAIKPFKCLISFKESYKPSGMEVQYTGSLDEPITIGSGESLYAVHFHLINFMNFRSPLKSLAKDDRRIHFCDRAIFEADDWKITIDELKTTADDVKLLSSQGGYAITHVGRVERISRTDFTKEECHSILKALSDFLSFVRGFRVRPVLLNGYSAENELVWEEWAASDATSWQNVYSWASSLPAKNFAQVFPEFLSWWKEWDEAAKRVIYWYCESNVQAVTVESSCILEQAALELIAWTYLKADFESDKSLKDKSTSQKLNYLFSKLKIPQEIPSDLTALRELANRQDKWKHDRKGNGAYVFVSVRNNITHSAPENQEFLNDTSIQERIEAWELGLWYLELVLLSLFSYKGEYVNRLHKGNRYFGDVELVP
ncbi:hypothetical protein IFO70_35640 [Phormidium tenue FACHB-886]|nr:hypothetical protein [Phormidium tenue FACHB-886]